MRTRNWLLAACLGALMFTACSAAPGLDDEAARKLQNRAASAKQLTVEQNFPAALAELQQLERDVTTAAEVGSMSQERKTRIEAAISTIKADLEAAMTPAVTPPATPAPATEPPGGSNEKEQEEEAEKDADRHKEQGNGKGND